MEALKKCNKLVSYLLKFTKHREPNYTSRQL